MDIVLQILLQSGKIFSLLLILLAFAVSACLLFKPKTAARLNTRFSAWTCTQSMADKMDSSVHTSEYLLRYRWLVGITFLIGAAFSFKFLTFDFNEKVFIALVLRPNNSAWRTGMEISIATVRWVLAAFSLVGFFTCLLMLFKPDLFRAFSLALDKVFSTEKLGTTVDSYHSIDEWALHHNILVGGALFLGTCFLLVYFISILFR
jgi:hypothetical protein